MTSSAAASAAARFSRSIEVANKGSRPPRSGRVTNEASPCGANLVAGLDDSCRHRLLGTAAPGARIVGAFVADAAVGAHDAGVVDEHVVGGGACVRILGIAVEVHLDDPVADC